jgi:AhpD family alkylhydroperoxidase
MAKLSVYDPPMCCSTGVCGPSVDKALVRFSADLEWLKQQGVPVERFNLSQQPGEFVENPTVKQAIDADGSKCLPLVLVDGREVCRGHYPTRQELAGFVGIAVQEAAILYTPAVAELVAVGASIAANCKPCLKYHYDKAVELGVSVEDIARAVDTAQMVKDVVAGQISDQANRYLGREESAPAPSCCSPGTSTPSKSKCC